MHLIVLAQLVTTVSEDHTLLGSVLIGAEALAAVALVGVMGLLGNFLMVKAKTSKLAQLGLVVWEKVQSTVAHVEAELRPEFSRALKDGKVTKEEGAQLKARALELLKGQLGEQLKDIEKAMGIFGPALDIYLSGLLERALDVQKLAQASPPVLAAGALRTSPR